MSFERGHALVIGVGTYVHIPWANIPISVVDAQAVTGVLGNVDLCGYPPEQVTLLHDATASKGGILGELASLSQVAEDHTILVYYCGHGAVGTDGNYYLTTHDSQVSNGKVVKGTGISEGELLDALREIKAKRLLLLFNACHSGEISPNLAFEEVSETFGDMILPTKSVDALLSAGEGRVIITACRPEQKSWIGGGKLSIFTQALVDGLSGKGYVPNNNGFIGAFGLYEHIYEAVIEATGKMNKVQEPELTVLRQVGKSFAVALYQGATDLGSFDVTETVMEGTAARTVEPARSERLFQQVVKTITASGERSVAAETISGSTIATGDHNAVQRGKYNISMGTAQGVVIGEHAQVEQNFSSIQGLSGAEIAALFQPLTQMIQQVPLEKRDEAIRLEQELQAEVAKGEKADDGRMAGLLNGLLKLVPGAVGAAVSIFATPVLSGVAGELTKMVLRIFGG